MLIKPEDLVYKIYSKLTICRTLLFWILIIFVVWTAIDPRWHVSVSQELFKNALKAMATILLTIGGITVGFVTIVVGMVKNKTKIEVTQLWQKFATYIIYPFAIVVFIGLILFLVEIGITFPDTSSSAPLLVLFGYLVANSFFIIIKASEVLINQAWALEERFKKIKELFPPNQLNNTFKLVRFEKQSGKIYIYDLIRKKRYWIYNWATFVDLGYPDGKWEEVDLDNIPEQYKDYNDDQDIISPSSVK